MNTVNYSLLHDEYKDKLKNNLFRKHYLQRDKWDSNLQSLIPVNFWYFDPEDKRTWYVDTPCQFFDEHGKEARYVILVRWWVEIDKRGFIRMSRINGWDRSDEVRYFDRRKKKWLEGKERKEFVNNSLKPRLKKTLGFDTLKNKRIRRYRFNFSLYYSEGDLRDRDGHHDVMDNPVAAKRIRTDLKGLYDFWLLATDDRPYNIIPMNPEAHNNEHNNKGDKRFEFYRELNYQNESYQWNQETGFI